MIDEKLVIRVPPPPPPPGLFRPEAGAKPEGSLVKLIKRGLRRLAGRSNERP